MMTLSFIILTWESGHYINKCLSSIASKCLEEEIDYEVIIVDNGSCDNTISIIEKSPIFGKGYVTVVQLEQNYGTTYTRNLGLQKAKGEYICVLDSDTEFGDGHIKPVFEFLIKESSNGLVAPQLVLADGTVQNSVKKFPTFFHKLVKIPKVIFNLQITDSDFYEDFPFVDTTEVDTAISACWFFRKSLLDLVGFLDENIFYSPEDLDFCFRVRKANKKILYYPSLSVLHHTQQISHKTPFSKISFSHFLGLLYYFRKHGGWFSVAL